MIDSSLGEVTFFTPTCWIDDLRDTGEATEWLFSEVSLLLLVYKLAVRLGLKLSVEYTCLLGFFGSSLLTHIQVVLQYLEQRGPRKSLSLHHMNQVLANLST